MLLRSASNFWLQYDQGLGLLRLEWIARSDARTLRASARHLLELLQELQVRQLLLDMNSVPNLSLDDQLWLGDHWMPSLVALKLERLVLIIATDRIHNQLAIDALHDLVQPAIRFESQYFSDADSALDWMTNNSARLPALSAEWAARQAL